MRDTYRKPLTAAIAAALALAPHPALSQQWTSGSGGAIYYNGGNVGIGVASPQAPLQVSGVRGNILLTSGESWSGIQFENLALQSSPTRWALYNGDGGEASDAISFYNYALGRDALTMTSGGNVGIGTINPQHLLHVAGTIGAEEILVTSTGADYVFEPGYRLKSLSEVAGYIEANHHLPDIPSAAEVKQKGMGVGEMEAKLLAKVEELTLHMIQQEKENQELRERIARLEKAEGQAAPPAAVAK